MGRDPQRLGDLEQRIQRRTAQTPLEFAVMGPIQPSQPAQKLLRHALLRPILLQDLPDQYRVYHKITSLYLS